VLGAGLNHRRRVADSRVEQSPEGEGHQEALSTWGAQELARRFGARDGPGGLGEEGRVVQRQEGNGAGDGERLHGRNKALKGKPHERIWHDTRPAGSGRTKAPRGRENLKAQAIGPWEARLTYAAAPGGETLKGKKPHGRSRYRR
jgi:hypothetical protein